MEHIIFTVIFAVVGALFTGIGICALRSKKPMHFYSGSTVREEELTDVPAYNRANGLMWIGFSLVFWLSAVLGLWSPGIAGMLAAAGMLAGIPVLAAAYRRIYRKYKAQ